MDAVDLVELLMALRRRGVRVAIDGDNLRLVPSSDASLGTGLSPAVAVAVDEHRDALMELVSRQPEFFGRPDSSPTTPSQGRLVMLDWRGDTPPVNATAAFVIDDAGGALEPGLLVAILQRMGRRHEALRLVFEASGAEVRQRTLVGLVPEIERTTHEDASRAAIMAWVAGLAARPFDLRQGPPWRVGLLTVTPTRHVLALVAHHSVIDEISLRTVLHDLAGVYADVSAPSCTTVDAALDALGPAPSYLAAVDEAHAVLGTSEASLVERSLARLGDLTVSPAPAVRSYAESGPARDGGVASAVSEAPTIDRQVLDLDATLVHALTAIGRDAGASLVSVFLAATGLVLAATDRRAGTPPEPLGIGLIVAGRTPVHASTVGLFAGTVVVRSAVDGSQAFRVLVANTAAAIAEARAEQALPFERLARPMARLLGGSPRDLLALQVNWIPGTTGFALPGTTSERLDAPPFAGVTDLVLEGRRLPDGGVRLTLSFPQPLAGTGRVAWLPRVGAVLRAAAERADEPGDALLRPGADELARLAHVEHGLPLADDRPHVLDRIEAVAAADPSRPAVIDERAPGGASGEVVTYAGLTTWARETAAALVRAGAIPGDAVVHRLPRGAPAVAALLGVLGTGAAAVVMDPALPDDEVSMRAARAGAVLAVEPVPFAAGPDGWVSSSAPTPSPPPRRDLAYVLFTSGSSGPPKGVAVEHDQLAAFIAGMQQAHPLDALDRVLVHTPLTFDVGLAEVLWPLASGATLVVAPDDGRVSSLIASARDHDVTVLIGVPTVLAAVVRHPDATRLTRLRTVFSIGEVLTPDLAAEVASTWPRAELVNLYGPTETTVASTSHVVDRSSLASPLPRGGSRDRVAIGRPLPGQWAGILDADEHRCGFGLAGELWIAGCGVARGYLDPEQTAGSFRLDPSVPGGRRYRTGDRARRRADGLLDFLGRVDEQLKIGGTRVEPEAVEAVIAAHPSVVAAAVTAWVAPTGRSRLAAFVVPADGGALDEVALRAWVRARLPAVLTPSPWTAVDHLPATTSGKLDRAALPAVRVARRPPRPPRTPTERRLVDAISDVLGLADLSVDDDFTELGGDSLAAVEVAEIAERDGWSVLPQQLIEIPTIERLAAVIAGSEGVGRGH